MFLKFFILLQRQNTPDFSFIKDFLEFRISQEELKQQLHRHRFAISDKNDETIKIFEGLLKQLGFDFSTSVEDVDKICEMFAPYKYSAPKFIENLLETNSDVIISKLNYGDEVHAGPKEHVVVDEHPVVLDLVKKISTGIANRDFSYLKKLFDSHSQPTDDKYIKMITGRSVKLSTIIQENVLVCNSIALLVQLAYANHSRFKVYTCAGRTSHIYLKDILTDYGKLMSFIEDHNFNIISASPGEYSILDFASSDEGLAHYRLTRLANGPNTLPFWTKEGGVRIYALQYKHD